MSSHDFRCFTELRKALDLSMGDGRGFVCPCAGPRAPEFAVGEWKVARDQLFERGVQDLISQVDVDNDLALLMRALERAKLLTFDEMTVKMRFCECLPWTLMGVAHHEEERARAHAQHVLNLWECTEDQTVASHHPVTIQILVTDARRHLERFASGVARDTLPELLTICTRFRFLPTSERTIEGRFSQISLATMKRKVSPAYASLRSRLSRWEGAVAEDPEVMQSTLEQFLVASKTRRLPGLFGLERDPGIAQELRTLALRMKTSTADLLALTARKMYSADASEQFRSFLRARQDNAKVKAATATARRSGGGGEKREPLTYGFVLETAMLEHDRFSLEAGFVYSLPSTADGGPVLTGLEDRFSASSTALAAPHARDAQEHLSSCGEGPERLGNIFFSTVRKSYTRTSEEDTAVISVGPSALARCPVVVLSKLGPDPERCWVRFCVGR